ncbi:hypothetical protein, partial [Staphylococcus pseudintermedius]|uniref:hypothetical protein n=1 Tax=Staphylococcus pseudintermedius TaxID=283734 RepID=UPI000D8AF5AF
IIRTLSIHAHTFKSEEKYLFFSDYIDYDVAIKLENIVLKNGCYFISMMFDNPFLILGPLSYINKSHGCLECGYQRRLQHSIDGDTYLQLLNKKKNNVNPLNTNNILFINYILDCINTDDLSLKGKFIIINLFNKHIYDSKIISIHNCKKCGLKRNEKNRSFYNLKNYFFNY